MEKKHTHIIRNSLFALKTVFRHAPAIATAYAILALTSSVFTVVQLLFLERLVNHVTAYINDPSRLYFVLLWGTLYVVSLIGAQAYSFTLGKLGKYLNRRLTKSLSPAIIDKFSRMDYHYYENAECRDVMSRMTANPQQTIHDTFFSVINGIGQVAKLVGMLGVFFRASVWIGLGAAFIGIPMSILNVRATVKQQRLLREATSDQRMGEYLQNLFSDKHSAYEIKIFHAKEHVLDIWHEVMKRIFERYVRITKILLRAQSIVSLLKIAYTSFAVITLVSGFISGAVQLGVVVSILYSIGNMFSILTSAAYCISDLGARTYEIGYYKEFMDFEERILGKENLPYSRNITFENVSFKYPGTEREILHNISFEIKSGEKIALVGVNGAGKSTIIKLLCGLYTPDSGRITIGGKDISELSQDAVRQVISVVFQDFGSYQLTLRENVAFGDLSKLDCDGSLREALTFAGAEKIAENGLDIHLGRLEEDGIDVSKGQWQRIAIARAFLSSADFIILDEPTASLDPKSKKSDFRYLGKVTKDLYTIMPMEITAVLILNILNSVISFVQVYVTADIFDAAGNYLSGTGTAENCIIMREYLYYSSHCRCC